MDDLDEGRASKRRRVETASSAADAGIHRYGGGMRTYERSISPPVVARNSRVDAAHVLDVEGERSAADSSVTEADDDEELHTGTVPQGHRRPLTHHSQKSDARQSSSPFRLTRIAELDDVANNDTVSLRDMIGDPDLASIWLFDYLFDLHFVMSHIHPTRLVGSAGRSTREPVTVYVIHGSWKKDSPHRMRLDEQKGVYAGNVVVRHVYWAEPFGTHHSKMMVLFKRVPRDDSGGPSSEKTMAQVVVHTANMIAFDWANMTQGLWISPWLLPMSKSKAAPSGTKSSAIGTGKRFKVDLLRYLKEYKHVTRELVTQLEEFDFASIRAAFVASAPSRDKLIDARPSEYTSFGWPGLKQVIKVAMSAKSRGTSTKVSSGSSDNIVVQISSIATISEKWFREFVDVLHTSTTGMLSVSSSSARHQNTSIIWPTVEEVRNSLNGYESGGSIHLKSDSAAQKKQLGWLRKYCHRWSNDSLQRDEKQGVHDAMRSLAAPHVKTYIRYDEAFEEIKWALLTSANLSTQAWGAGMDKEGRVRISSWEVGVLVWPELYENDEQQQQAVKMVPVFGGDGLPKQQSDAENTNGHKVVPLRIPYGLPLFKYADTDEPWCKTETYVIPDSRGMKWET